MQKNGFYWITIGLLIVFVAIFYLPYIESHPGFTGDNVKFQYLGSIIGIPHPTGYPLYLGISYLFSHAAYVKLVLTILTLIWTPFALFFLHNSRENEVLSVAGFVSPLAFLMHSLTYDYASMESILARFLFLTLVMAAVSRFLIYRTTQRIGVRQ